MRKGLGKNLAQKCLEHWNAAVSVDEGTNITSANQRLSSINDLTNHVEDLKKEVSC